MDTAGYARSVRVVVALGVAIVVLSALSIALRSGGTDEFDAGAWAWATSTTAHVPEPEPEIPGTATTLPEGPALPDTPQLPGAACTTPGASTPTGRFIPVEVSTGATSGPGTLRVRVEVEQGVTVDPGCFASTIETILGDERGWAAGDVRSFVLAHENPDIIVTLADGATVDRLCAPFPSEGVSTCWNGSRVVISAQRWADGSDGFDDADRARVYEVNHGIGLALGHRVTDCPAADALAPVMMHQADGASPCVANPWPASTDVQR